MIFIDSNVPMYLIGEPHPLKIEAQRTIEALSLEGQRLVSSLEVLQEILHRYVAINRREAIPAAFTLLYEVCDEIIAITESDILAAKDLVLLKKSLSARDAVHVSTMKRLGIKTLFSFDRGFDKVPGIERIPI